MSIGPHGGAPRRPDDDLPRFAEHAEWASPDMKAIGQGTVDRVRKVRRQIDMEAGTIENYIRILREQEKLHPARTRRRRKRTRPPGA